MTEHTIRTDGKWTLEVINGNLEARKEMPYDGALRYTTESHETDHGSDVRYNLSEWDVVKEYVRNVRPKQNVRELLDTVKAAEKAEC